MAGWTDFERDLDNPGVQVAWKLEGEWIHALVSPLDEPKPRDNHVHIKYPYQKGQRNFPEESGVLCSIKVDGYRVHSRRQFIEKMNQITRMNLPYT